MSRVQKINNLALPLPGRRGRDEGGTHTHTPKAPHGLLCTKNLRLGFKMQRLGYFRRCGANTMRVIQLLRALAFGVRVLRNLVELAETICITRTLELSRLLPSSAEWRWGAAGQRCESLIILFY